MACFLNVAVIDDCCDPQYNRVACYFFCQSKYEWFDFDTVAGSFSMCKSLFVVAFIGFLVFVYGEVVGRFWRWDYLLCGKLDHLS